METKEQIYIGKITQFEESEMYVDCVILHYDVPNKNAWTPVSGCLDAFLAELARVKKNVPAYYQHNENFVIGKWVDFNLNGNTLTARLLLDNIPFVKETVIPQLKSGTLQGASPTISANKDMWNDTKRVWEIIDGMLIEASLVALPADFKSEVVAMKASMEAKRKENFEIDLLTL